MNFSQLDLIILRTDNYDVWYDQLVNLLTAEGYSDLIDKEYVSSTGQNRCDRTELISDLRQKLCRQSLCYDDLYAVCIELSNQSLRREPNTNILTRSVHRALRLVEALKSTARQLTDVVKVMDSEFVTKNEPTENYLDDKEKARQAAACLILKNTLGDREKSYTVGVREVRKLIEQLHDLHGKPASINFLMEELLLFKWRANWKAEIFINELNKLKYKILNHRDNKCDEQLFVDKLLQELPTFMKHLKSYYLHERKIDTYDDLAKLIIKVYNNEMERRKSKRIHDKQQYIRKMNETF